MPISNAGQRAPGSATLWARLARGRSRRGHRRERRRITRRPPRCGTYSSYVSGPLRAPGWAPRPCLNGSASHQLLTAGGAGSGASLPGWQQTGNPPRPPAGPSAGHGTQPTRYRAPPRSRASSATDTASAGSHQQRRPLSRRYSGGPGRVRRHQRQGRTAPGRPAETVTLHRRRKLRLSAPALDRRTGHPDVRGHLSHRPTGRVLRHGSALPNRASGARKYAGRAAAMSRFVMFSGHRCWRWPWGASGPASVSTCGVWSDPPERRPHAAHHQKPNPTGCAARPVCAVRRATDEA